MYPQALVSKVSLGFTSFQVQTSLRRVRRCFKTFHGYFWGASKVFRKVSRCFSVFHENFRGFKISGYLRNVYTGTRGGLRHCKAFLWISGCLTGFQRACLTSVSECLREVYGWCFVVVQGNARRCEGVRGFVWWPTASYGRL